MHGKTHLIGCSEIFYITGKIACIGKIKLSFGWRIDADAAVSFVDFQYEYAIVPLRNRSVFRFELFGLELKFPISRKSAKYTSGQQKDCYFLPIEHLYDFLEIDMME